MKIIVLFFCLGIAIASCFSADEYMAMDNTLNELEPVENIFQLHRAKRQFNMQGGGSRGQGFDIDANTRFPIWQSQNERTSVHGTAGYSQHLGGPYGNSRPDYRGGIQFTHRF